MSFNIFCLGKVRLNLLDKSGRTIATYSRLRISTVLGSIFFP